MHSKSSLKFAFARSESGDVVRNEKTHGLIASIVAVFRVHGSARDSGGKVSFRTREKKFDVVAAAFRQLRQLGFKVQDCHSLRGAHITALVKLWERQNLSASTIAGRLSVLRTFSKQIGKAGLVMPTAMYTNRAHRSTINTMDKSWPAHGVDIAAKIEEVRAFNPRIGAMLDLQQVFGLRAGESIQFRPHAADAYGGNIICIRWGTKGGRERFEPVETAEQRRVLDQAKSFAKDLNSSVSDPKLSLKSARGFYWRTVARFGLTKRALGVTSHGLRHGFACDKYRQLTGQDAPVRGGGAVPEDLHRFAEDRISRDCGHSRTAIVKAYIGGKGGKK